MGKPSTRHTASVMDAREAELMHQALKLHARGKTFQAIAGQLGVSMMTASRLVREAKAHYWRLSETEARHQRAMEMRYLEELWAAVADEAMAGNVAYVDRALKIRESYRKLMGLDAPAAPLVDARQQTLIVTTEELARYDTLAKDPAGLAALEKFARGYAEAAEQEPGQD